MGQKSVKSSVFSLLSRHYIDYNFEEFRVFSALIYEYIDAYKDKYFSTFQKYESLDAIIRIILEEMMGVDIGLSNYLNIPESDVKKTCRGCQICFFQTA